MTINWEKVSTDGKTILPDGAYRFCVRKPEVKDTKSGGKMLSVRLTVVDGEHEGKSIFGSFNIENQNETAVNIGLGNIKAIYLSNGEEPSDEWGRLDGMFCDAKVTVTKNDQYGESNQIRIIAPKKGEPYVAPKIVNGLPESLAKDEMPGFLK